MFPQTAIVRLAESSTGEVEPMLGDPIAVRCLLASGLQRVETAGGREEVSTTIAYCEPEIGDVPTGSTLQELRPETLAQLAAHDVSVGGDQTSAKITITESGTYRFSVRARNVVGDSPAVTADARLTFTLPPERTIPEPVYTVVRCQQWRGFPGLESVELRLR